jgi:dipeptidase D
VFETDPIEAVVEDGWVRANGTTLGADNGIGVAIILALLASDDVAHGPLEALFTVNEEDGYTGAMAVKPGLLRGTMLINLDSEEAGSFTIGSAGGIDIDAVLAYEEKATPAGFAGARLTVSGLQGGHSGMDIHRGRGNAIKLLARALNVAAAGYDLSIGEMTGGDRYNAIPREATANIALPAAQLPGFTATMDELAAAVGNELAATEPDLRIAVEPGTPPARVLDMEVQQRVISALNACPNGVIRMSDAVPGLVETSTNLGTISLGGGDMQAGFLVRSSVNSARDAVQQMIDSVFTLAAIETRTHDAYDSWQPDPDSPLLALMLATYRDRFGVDAGVMAVHAGLEPSAFSATYPEMDMVSAGPTIQNVHSPAERLEIASVGTTYDLIAAVLERVPAMRSGRPPAKDGMGQ